MTGHLIPVLRVILDGKDLTDRIAPLLSTLTINEKRGDEADTLEMMIDDSAGTLAIPRKGAVITVELGYQGEPLVNKGSYKVDQTGHSGPPDVISISAKAADFTAELRTRREISYRDTTLGTILGAIAGRQGLALRCAEDLSSTSVTVIAQSRESDSQFLARLGKRYDAVATIKAGALVFAKKGSGKTATGKKLPAAVITRQDNDRHDWKTADRDGAYTGVSASWHSTGSGRRHSVRVGKTGKVKRLKKVYGSEVSAREACQAEFSRIGRAGGTLSLNLAQGRPSLFPEQEVTVSGFKPEIDATGWLIAEATHVYGGGGLLTDINCEPS